YKDDFMPPIGEYNHLAQAATGAPYGLDFIIARFNDLPVKGEGGNYTTESSLQGSSQSSSDGYGLLGSSQPFLGSPARDSVLADASASEPPVGGSGEACSACCGLLAVELAAGDFRTLHEGLQLRPCDLLVEAPAEAA